MEVYARNFLRRTFRKSSTLVYINVESRIDVQQITTIQTHFRFPIMFRREKKRDFETFQFSFTLLHPIVKKFIIHRVRCRECNRATGISQMTGKKRKASEEELICSTWTKVRRMKNYAIPLKRLGGWYAICKQDRSANRVKQPMGRGGNGDGRRRREKERGRCKRKGRFCSQGSSQSNVALVTTTIRSHQTDWCSRTWPKVLWHTEHRRLRS